MDFSLTLGIFLSLALALFFSGIEVALLSANKIQIELMGRQGRIPGRIMSFFVKHPTWFIGTTLLGNIAALILFGIFATQLIIPWLMPEGNTLGGLPLLLLAFLLTVAILYTVEFLSKSIFIVNSNKVIYAMAIPFACISLVLFPIVFATVSLAKFVIVYVLKLEYSMNKPVFGLTDVNHYLKSMHQIRQQDENLELDKKIFNKALEFRSVRVRDCMIPRTEITAVSIDAGIKKLHEAFVETGHSKIIIYKETIDDVIGYCHSSALFKKPEKIEDILTPIITVPESTLASQLMVRFINERKSLACVVDEFGGTSGIVSMEDVIEEIFGEIEDEHDKDQFIEQKLDENTYLLSARLEVDYLNERYGWNLPQGDYDTLGGLILSFTEDLPHVGDAVNVPPHTFIIYSTQENRINTVKLILGKNEEED